MYRLISADTYEMALFSSASRKYGLDEAVLGFAAGTDPEADSARIADLLRNGAHGLLGDAEAGAKKGEAFAGEDINQVCCVREVLAGGWVAGGFRLIGRVSGGCLHA